MKKEKINSKNMKKKTMKQPKYRSEEQEAIRKFIIILIIVVAVVIGVYFLTKKIVKNNTTDTTDKSSSDVKIDYTKVTVGTMFNRADSEYYVILYSSADTTSSLYSMYVSKYEQATNHLPIYTCDLSDSSNTSFVATDKNPSNPKAKTIKDVSFGPITLVKIKDGKITKYFETVDTIKTELGL